MGGFGFPRSGGVTLTALSAGTRRVRAPMLLFSKAPLGPEGDLNDLFAVGANGGALVSILGGMDDPEEYF